jgi:anti-anti-sigma factor
MSQLDQQQGTQPMMTIDDRGDYILVSLQGVIDDAMKPLFDDQLHPLIESRGRGVVLDLSGCKRITSGGISLLVTLTARANMSGSCVVIAQPQSFVKAVFHMSKLDHFFDVRDTILEAVNQATGKQVEQAQQVSETPTA